MDQQPTTGQVLEALLDFRDAMGSMETRLGVRIDAVETRLGSVETRLEARIDSVEARLETRIDSVENRLSERMMRMEDRFSLRVDGLELEMRKGFEAVNKRIDGFEPPRHRGTR